MKVSCVVLALVSMVAADFYNSKYDSFDVQPLLDYDRLLLTFVMCFIDKGPCTFDMNDIKKVIPEALATTCSRCTPNQKQQIKKFIKAVKEHKPEVWRLLTHKFDKEEKYKESLNKFLQEE